MNTRLAIVAIESKAKHQSIAERIDRRLDLLRSWRHDGIPQNKQVPRNLKEARVWQDAELGIVPISSPNEFTTTHQLHGNDVREIASLLTALRRPTTRPKVKGRSKKSGSHEKFDRKAFDRQLGRVVSQWQTERDQRLRQERRADAAEARGVLLLEENAKKDALIADLRRQIAARKGLGLVK